MPMRFSLLAPVALALSLLGPVGARAQDAYFSQPFATRLAANAAYAGLLDDYGATLAYRNQLPNLPGAYQSTLLAADWRLPTRGLHHALGLVLGLDRAGEVGYGRLEATASYAYHRRLTSALALSGGLGLGYGRQSVGFSNLVFGDQLDADGTVLGPTAEPQSFVPVDYFSVDPGLILYTSQAWLSLAAHHANRPSLGFRRAGGGSGSGGGELPVRLGISGGYKLFLQRPGPGQAAAEIREISLAPTAAYTRQGGSSRTEAGLFATVAPLTFGATYRNLGSPGEGTTGNTGGAGGVERQQVVALTTGLSFGDFRLGYCYDAALDALSADLGGAHELTLTLRSFDALEGAYRRLRRRAYPAAPFPAF